jgi:hypothetical protein
MRRGLLQDTMEVTVLSFISASSTEAVRKVNTRTDINARELNGEKTAGQEQVVVALRTQLSARKKEAKLLNKQVAIMVGWDAKDSGGL